MDILHIIPLDAQYAIPLAESLYRNDKKNRHTFMVTVPFQTVLAKNVKMLQVRDLQCVPVYKRLNWIRRQMYILKCAKKADHIVWHTFRSNGGYNPFLLFLHQSLLKKSTWIPAEGEAGSFMFVKNRFLSKFAEKVNGYVQRRVSNIGVPVATYEQGIRAKGILKPTVTELPYVMNLAQNEAFSLAKECSNHAENKRIFVQLGISSQRDNWHKVLIDTLQTLEDYKEAVVFIPFYYALPGACTCSGTKVYKKSVQMKAAKLESCVIYRNQETNAETMVKSLNRMDIVLLGNDMTCQMDVILLMLMLEKRIFLPEESSLYQYLREQGTNVYTLDQLSELGSLNEAKALPGSNLPPQMMQEFEEEQVIRKWDCWADSVKNNTDRKWV